MSGPPPVLADPDEIDASLDRLENFAPSTQEAAPQGVTFAASIEEATSSGQMTPNTLREMRGTDRPTGDEPATESFQLEPETRVTEEAEELSSAELLDVDTGSHEIDLEKTNAQPGTDDEIVVADELAEIVDDEPQGDENTETGTTVPPFGSADS